MKIFRSAIISRKHLSSSLPNLLSKRDILSALSQSNNSALYTTSLGAPWLAFNMESFSVSTLVNLPTNKPTIPQAIQHHE